MTLGRIQSPPPGGHVGVHGMVVFGNDHFSHIPMFHAPHDYQIVMDVALRHPDIPPQESFGDELHTFVPDPFSLGDLVSGKLHELHGTLYRGNFEDGGQAIREDVTVDVHEVLESKHLDAHSVGSADLDYVLYGSGNERYLVHPIVGNADFDQILRVQTSLDGYSAEELRRGVPLHIQDRSNDVDHRLLPGQGSVTASDAAGHAVPLEALKELSCLVGPHFTGPPQAH